MNPRDLAAKLEKEIQAKESEAKRIKAELSALKEDLGALSASFAVREKSIAPGLHYLPAERFWRP